MASHRDLVAWQVSHNLAVSVHKHAAHAWHPSAAALLDQLRRSALSVPLNIAEGYAFGPSARCTNHLRIAYGWAVETVAVLEVMIECDDAHLGDLEVMLVQANRAAALVYGLVRHRITHPPQRRE